eukprot:3929239-Amphidinium_carterae.1
MMPNSACRFLDMGMLRASVFSAAFVVCSFIMCTALGILTVVELHLLTKALREKCALNYCICKVMFVHLRMPHSQK